MNNRIDTGYPNNTAILNSHQKRKAAQKNSAGFGNLLAGGNTSKAPQSIKTDTYYSSIKNIGSIGDYSGGDRKIYSHDDLYIQTETGFLKTHGNMQQSKLILNDKKNNNPLLVPLKEAAGAGNPFKQVKADEAKYSYSSFCDDTCLENAKKIGHKLFDPSSAEEHVTHKTTQIRLSTIDFNPFQWNSEYDSKEPSPPSERYTEVIQRKWNWIEKGE